MRREERGEDRRLQGTASWLQLFQNGRREGPALSAGRQEASASHLQPVAGS